MGNVREFGGMQAGMKLRVYLLIYWQAGRERHTFSNKAHTYSNSAIPANSSLTVPLTGNQTFRYSYGDHSHSRAILFKSPYMVFRL